MSLAFIMAAAIVAAFFFATFFVLRGERPNLWRRVGLVGSACLRKEGTAFVALMVSLGGAGVLSFMLWGNLLYFRTAGATDQLFLLSVGMLLLIGIVLMSSHRLLGSKLAVDAEILSMKLRFSQGDDTAIAPGPVQ